CPFKIWVWVSIAALLFLALLAVHLVRIWRSRSPLDGWLVTRLFLGCMGIVGPATVASLAFATPYPMSQHGFTLCESMAYMLLGLALMIPALFDCWKLASTDPSRCA